MASRCPSRRRTALRALTPLLLFPGKRHSITAIKAPMQKEKHGKAALLASLPGCSGRTQPQAAPRLGPHHGTAVRLSAQTAALCTKRIPECRTAPLLLTHPHGAARPSLQGPTNKAPPRAPRGFAQCGHVCIHPPAPPRASFAECFPKIRARASSRGSRRYCCNSVLHNAIRRLRRSSPGPGTPRVAAGSHGVQRGAALAMTSRRIPASPPRSHRHALQRAPGAGKARAGPAQHAGFWRPLAARSGIAPSGSARRPLAPPRSTAAAQGLAPPLGRGPGAKGGGKREGAGKGGVGRMSGAALCFALFSSTVGDGGNAAECRTRRLVLIAAAALKIARLCLPVESRTAHG